MNENFSWVKTYNAIAKSILEYKNKRKELLQGIFDIFKKMNLQNNYLEDKIDGVSYLFEDICPFTVMGIFNRNNTEENRRTLIKELASFLNVDIEPPSSFAGIPTLFATRSWFFGGKEDRRSSDINNLWDMFEIALKYADDKSESNQYEFIKMYDTVVKQPIVKWNLTMGLYWINAEEYLTLDGTSREYVVKELKLTDKLNKLPSGSEYLNMVDKLKGLFSDEKYGVHSFYELSYNAWISGNKEDNAIENEDEVNYYSEIKVALKELGDSGLWREICDVIEKRNKLPNIHTTKSWREIISSYLQYKCSDSPSYQGKEDLFTWDKETKVWGLRDKDSEKPNDDTSYWWLNAKPDYWSFSAINIGETVTYDLYTEKNNKRKIFDNYLNAKKGDVVIGYETTPKLEIVCLLEVEREQDGKTISFKKTKDLDKPIPYSEFSGMSELSSMEFLVNRNGSFFKVAENEYEVIMDLIGEDEDEPVIPIKKYNTYTADNFLKEIYMTQEKYNLIKTLLEDKKNIILQGAPGVGKSYLAQKLAYSIMGVSDESRVGMIQFHQSYSYEDFIEGYRPTKKGGFELKEGIFKRFVEKAKKDSSNKYYFIIDEINRGNLSKIFGELMLLIENDKRKEKYKLTTTYGSENFYVPENIHIIGLMNTADRGLAMLDYALRRRFCFITIDPAFENEKFKVYITGQDAELGKKIIADMTKLNQVIKDDLGVGFRIGHSYFCNSNNHTNDWYQRILNYEILPLLEEYWFDNEEKYKARKKELLPNDSD